jgi:hypothetical protein
VERDACQGNEKPYNAFRKCELQLCKITMSVGVLLLVLLFGCQSCKRCSVTPFGLYLKYCFVYSVMRPHLEPDVTRVWSARLTPLLD